MDVLACRGDVPAGVHGGGDLLNIFVFLYFVKLFRSQLLVELFCVLVGEFTTYEAVEELHAVNLLT